MGPFGRIDLTHVTGFESRQVTAPVRVDRIDGVLLATELPKGWDGAFELERGSSAIDDFIAQIEAAYNAGNPVPSGTLYQGHLEQSHPRIVVARDGVVGSAMPSCGGD
jgi:hypothetical protein